ncbi:hypothetical protein ACWEQ7_30395 [Streptomyces sp. NPDC004069]
MSDEFRGERPAARSGESAVFRLGSVSGDPVGTRGGFRLQRRRLAMNGDQVMLKEPVASAHVPFLDREFEISKTLVRRYGPQGVPRQLVRVLARDTLREPPRLLLDWRGDCLGEWQDPDALHEDRALGRALRDLFTAVAALHECGVVHGRISPEHLWWDRDGLQLSGLDGALEDGERAHDRPPTQWDPPGQVAGRVARTQDDVYSAGLVAFWLATGEQLPHGAGQEEIRGRLDLYDVWIGDLLRYVFPAAGARLPSAESVRQRLTPRGEKIINDWKESWFQQQLAEADQEFSGLRSRQSAFRASTAGRGGSPLGVPRPRSPGAPGADPGNKLWRRLFGRRGHGADPTGPAAAGRRVECPVCLTELDWDQLPRTIDDGSGTLVPREPELTGRGASADLAQEARSYRTCPGNSAVGAHNLPERYPSFGTEPVRIGMVGASSTGKSHLLAAMIHAMTDAEVTSRYGLTVEGLDQRQFGDYHRSVIDPLIGDRQELKGTPVAAELHFAAGLIITDRATGRHHSVVFFDVAGERLERAGPEVDFINRLGGLLCVVDPVRVRGLARFGRDTAQGAAGDAAVRAVLQRLKESRPRRGEDFLRLPCALVVTKSDLLRHRGYDEVEPWLPGSLSGPDGAGPGGPDAVEQESRAVYRMLRARGGERWLDPVKECENATLHLASATGTTPHDHADPDGVRRFPGASFGQHRVVEPLLSLLAMKGVLTGPGPGLAAAPDRARSGA